MASIKFDITGDNKNFLDSMKQVRDDVSRTSKIIEEVGKNFNIATVDDKIEALSKVIRDNEDVILRHQNTINKWKKDAEAAFNSGDTKLFEVITNDIEAEAKSMQELINETNEYRDALAMVNAMAGNSTGNVTAPMLFNTEEEYRNVQRLTSGIEDLRMQIATFEGSESDLQGLRSQLSGMQDELRGAQMKAVEAAAALGEDGEKAAEVSQRFFQLSDAVDKQTGKVAELSNKLNDAATALENAKASGDTQAIDDATIKYDALADQLQSAKMELVNLRSEHEKVKMTFHGDSTMNLRTQLRNLTVEIATLTLNYRQMSDEEKRSSAGRELMMKLQELTTRAGDLRDAMADVNRAITSTASDTKNFDALAGGFNVVTSSIGAVTGAAALFGAEQEDLIAIQTKLQASLAISNALSVIQNNLQKESALMIGVTNLQRKAAVLGENLVIAAKGKNIIVTKAATVAQAAFNVVAKANPYVLLATALISVVGAIALFTSGTKEATQAEKLHQEALEKSKEAAEQYKNTLSSSYAGMMSKYSELRREWNRLSSDHQRTKWIKDNKSAFNELGLSVNGVKDAEDIFRNNTQNVVDSFKRRAQAAALAAQMTELYRQQMDLEQKYYDRYNTRKVYQGQAAPEGTSMYADRTGGTYNGGRYTYNQGSGKFAFTAKGAEEYNAALLESDASLVQINNDWKAIGDKIDDIDGKLQSLGETSTKKLSPSASTNGTTTTTPTTPKHKKDDPRIKNEQDIAKAILDLQNANEKEKIDLMEDSTEKRLALSKYEFERRRDELDRQHKELVEKRGGNLTEAEEKAFTDARLLNEQRYNDEVKDIISDEFDTRQRYMRAYLAQYGTYEEKRQAITQKYEDEISKAKTEGEKLTLKKNMQEDLDELEEKYGKVKSFVVELFEDTSKKSIKEIQRIIDKYEALVAFLKGEHSQAGRKSLIKEFGFTDKEIDKAIEKLDKEGFDSIDSFMNRLKSLKEEISDRSPWQKFKKDINDAVDMLRKSKGDSDKIGTAIGNIGEACTAYLPQVEKFASGLYSIFGIDDSAAKNAITAINGLSTATTGIGQIISGNYLDGITNTVDGLSQSFNGLADMINDIYSKRDLDDVYSNIELEAIRKSVDKIVEKMESGSMADAIEEYNEAMQRYNEGLAKAQQNVQDAFSESSSSIAGRYNHRSINYYMNDIGSKEDIEKVNRLLGTNLDSFGDLWLLSPDQLAEIEEKLPYVFSIIEKGIETMSENASASSDDEWAREALAAYMEFVGKKKEIEDAFNQKMTGTTLENVQSEFRNTLSDMTSDAETFTEDFEDMLVNAIVNSMMSDKYNEKLKQWYQSFSDAFANSDGNLSEADIQNLQESYNAIMNAAVEERNALLDSLNISPNGNKYEQKASQGGWQSMGEDTGQEINGRFTALQASGERISEGIITMVTTMAAIYTNTETGNLTLLEIRNLMITNNAFLEDILEATKVIYKDFGKKLDKINSNTK